MQGPEGETVKHNQQGTPRQGLELQNHEVEPRRSLQADAETQLLPSPLTTRGRRAAHVVLPG